MNWGHWIIVAFTAFAGIIISLVIISMRQEVSLVEKNYYEEELAYEKQIDRLNNYQSLENKPHFTKNNDQLNLAFPKSVGQVQNGILHFYRPSEAGLDRKFQLKLDSNRITSIPLSDMKSGLWKLKLSWANGQNEYYSEESINL